MWDSNAPLQLLKSMPQKLSKENLEKLQLVIDADKYKNSLVSGFDLCGMYAPFCRGCQKTSIYPCALAYLNMMKASGMDIEIDAKPIVEPEIAKTVSQSEIIVDTQSETAFEESAATLEEEVSEIQSAEIETDIEEAEPEQEIELHSEQANEIEQEVQPVGEPLSEPKVETAKNKIRIAVARRKA